MTQQSMCFNEDEEMTIENRETSKIILMHEERLETTKENEKKKDSRGEKLLFRKKQFR